MRDMLGTIVLDRSRAARPQIEEQMRDLILDGKLRPGTKLPSSSALAELLSTHVPTVHAALRPLVLEGLLSRAHRSGTFVREREKRITCAGIYYGDDFLTSKAFRMQAVVHGAIHAEIKRILFEMDINTSVWIDTRPVEIQNTPWPELVRAVERREIQAVISSTADRVHLDWLSALPVPSAHGSSWHRPNTVTDDGEMFWELSMRALAERGCHSVGIIARLFRHRPRDFEKAVEVASELGIAMRDEWTFTMDSDAPEGVMPNAGEGYAGFCTLWKRNERPDGLIVFPDALSSGVILALLEQGVRVPDDLAVVMHKDQDIDMFCPLPVTFVGSSARRRAEALVEQVMRQARGEACESVVLPYERTDSYMIPLNRDTIGRVA